MKRFIGITLLTLCVLRVSFCQETASENYISKGQWLIGGSFSFGATKGFNSFGFSVNPMGGYFLGKKIAVGLSTGLGHTKSYYNTSSSRFSVQPFFRYYFTQKRLALYGDVGFGVSWSKDKYLSYYYNIPMEEKNTTLTYKIGVGADYFITKNVALEGNLRYISNDFPQGDINFSIGLQFFIR